MTEEQVKKIVEKTYKSFDKRIGDTPTDALQLVNKQYVDDSLSVSVGYVHSNAAGTPFPIGFSVSHDGTGLYTISYPDTLEVPGVSIVPIGALVSYYLASIQTTTSFQVQFQFSTSGLSVDTDFTFILS